MRTVRGMVLIVLTCVTSLALAVPAYAQNTGAAQQRPQQDTDQGVGIGALGGFTVTSSRGEDSDCCSSGTGAIFGIWFGGNRNGRVGFMGELNYAQKKIKDATDDNTHLTTNYLEIPALFRINIGSRMREGLSVYALVGPVFDIRLSSKLVEDGVEVPEAELENQFSAADIGLMAGGGVEFNRVGFEIRGNWGLRRLATDEALDAGNLPDVKNTSLQFVFKFRFN